MKKLYGVTVAMVTPFTEDNRVDYDGVARLTNMLIKKGVNCLYPCGTTGEMLRMTVEERKKTAETVIEAAAGRVPVFIHCGAMRQEDTIELLQHAQKAGADGAGIVTPEFFGASDRELTAYYKAAADSVPELPIYLYNIPQCAGNDIKAETAQEIADQCPNVIGMKYSFADINRTIDYIGINNGTFSVLHGLDRAFTGMLALGCDGTVSGISCVFPEPFVAVYQAYINGDLKRAQELQKVCVKFCDALKRGSNMSYFKEALKMRGQKGGWMRKPQLDLEPAEIKRLQAELTKLCDEAGITLKAEPDFS